MTTLLCVLNFWQTLDWRPVLLFERGNALVIIMLPSNIIDVISAFHWRQVCPTHPTWALVTPQG